MSNLIPLNKITYVSTLKYANSLGAILELAVLNEKNSSIRLVENYDKRYIADVWSDEIKVYKKNKKIITFADSLEQIESQKQVAYKLKVVLPVSFGLSACNFFFSKDQVTNGIDIKDLILMNRDVLDTQRSFEHIVKRHNLENKINFEKKLRKELEKGE